MKAHRWVVGFAAVLVAGCASPGPAVTSSQSGQPSSPPVSRVLTMSINHEPPYIAAQSPLPVGQGFTDIYLRLFNATLDLYDGQARPFGYLAESLPQLNTDSWIVFPDGR